MSQESIPPSQTQTQPDDGARTSHVVDEAVEEPQPWGRLIPFSKYGKDLGLQERIDLFQTTVVIGRRDASDVQVKAPQVSGRHATLHFHEDAVMLIDESTNGTWVSSGGSGSLKKIHKSSYLVCNGSEILVLNGLTERVGFVLYIVNQQRGRGYEPGSLEAKYDVRERLLGSGTFAQVRLGIDRQTGDKFAVKLIDKKRFSRNHGSDRCEALKDEVEILRHISHPNIIKLYDFFENEQSMWLVLELVEGGDLFDLLTKNGKGVSESRARTIFRQLVSAVGHLHEKNIVHRDLKPENILVSPGEDLIKLSDFGLSRALGSTGSLMETMCGTPQYLAPEIIGGARVGYGKEVDLWSLGVLLYVLLSGSPPFKDNNQHTILELVKAGRYSFTTPHWDSVSESAKDLVQRLMQVDRSKRLCLKGAQEHPWMKSEEDTEVAANVVGRKRSRADSLVDEACPTPRKLTPKKA